MDDQYKQQVDLLLDIMPYVAEESCFALKGGTALNLFHWNMPRLSVDIDLTLTQPNSRAEDIERIEHGLLQIKQKLESKLRLRVNMLSNSKLLAYRGSSKPVKIEPSINLRGSVFPVEVRDLQKNVEDLFHKTLLDIPILSFADLYGGKIVAALDRQHPRDLFDIKLLFEKDGITDQVLTAFVVYLLSSNRPIHEILNPNKLDISSEFKEHFEGMTSQPVQLIELLDAREQLTEAISERLTENHRKFIYSIKSLEPQWDLFEKPECQNMPGIQWKLRNIEQLRQKDIKKYEAQCQKLSKILNL